MKRKLKRKTPRPKKRARSVAPERRPVHDNIRTLRKELKLSQRELGAKCGADKTLVSHWERAMCSPRSAKLPAVAAALNTTVDDLLATRAA